MEKGKIAGAVVVLIFVGVIAYFFISSGGSTNEIPPYVTGEMRVMYEWAKTLKGCKYEGHKHTRHCFWKDNGNFDKHGITCSVCFDIAKKTKEMHEQGKDVCEIRKTIDKFYEPNKQLGTETPMPEGCEP